MMAFCDALRRFYQGLYYPIAVILLVFAGHVLELDILFAALIVLSVIPALLLCADLRFLIAPYLSIYFVISVGDFTPSNTGLAERFLRPSVLGLMAVLALVFLAAFVCFMIRNRRVRSADTSIVRVCNAGCRVAAPRAMTCNRGCA